ncbi:MAG: PH domain-containing protein [Xanthomonadales bacterium]|nr:PH domain-containing protein [Xanthomonadales bacterium]
MSESLMPPGKPLQADPVEQWHRISPLSILFYGFAFIRDVGLNALPALVVAAAALGKSLATQAWLLSAIVLLVLLLAAYGALSFLRFRYALAGDRLLVQRGVLQREALDISFERIQNINITTPFYMRPFGLAVLAVDTAGSSGKEVSLFGVKTCVAEDIRRTIAARLNENNTAGAAAQISDDALQQEGELIVALKSKDILLYGLTANFLLWVVLGTGFFFSSGDSSQELLDQLAEWLQLGNRVDQIQARGGTTLLVLLGTSLLALILLALPMLSMMGALFRYHGYQLLRSEDRYRCSRGLLSKHDESLSQHKIQAVVWKQNAIARLLGRINLQLQQASAGVSVQAQQNSGMPGARPALIVPAQTPPEAARLSAEFLTGARPERARYTGISRLRYTLVSTAWIMVPLTLALGILAMLTSAGFLLISAMATLALLLIFYRISGQYGLAVDGDFGYHRSGFIGRTITVFPLFKVQRVDLIQTPWQARRGLANLTIHLASHSLTLSYLPVSKAERFRDLAIYHAESSQRRWF